MSFATGLGAEVPATGVFGSDDLSTRVDEVGILASLDLSLEMVVDLGADEDDAIIRSIRDAMLSDEAVRSSRLWSADCDGSGLG